MTEAQKSNLFMKVFGVLVVSLAGCAASGDAVEPPEDELFFPTALASSSVGAEMFVVNANSDLSFNSGTILSFDADQTRSVVDDWVDGQVVPQGCTRDEVQPHVLVCPADNFLVEGKVARVGSFASAISVQQLASGDDRLFVSVRGDPSVTWINSSTGALNCHDTKLPPHRCDDTHSFGHLRDDDELPFLPEEPFQLYIDGTNGYGVVSHLSASAVSLFSAPTDGTPPMLTDILGNIFAANLNGTVGSYGVAGRKPGTASDHVYITSRTERRVQMMSVDTTTGTPQAIRGEFFFMTGVVQSDEARAVRFFDDGKRMAVLHSDPPTVQVYDTEEDSTGFPNNTFVGASQACDSASDMVVHETPEGRFAYVTCFSSGELWTIDLDTQSVANVTLIGRGPSGISLGGNDLLWIANFLDDSLSVVDISNDARFPQTGVLRLGDN